jgi:hypothetical protein
MYTGTMICGECGRKLLDEERDAGFCADCNAKIENDLRILRDSEDGNFTFLADLQV